MRLYIYSLILNAKYVNKELKVWQNILFLDLIFVQFHGTLFLWTVV